MGFKIFGTPMEIKTTAASLDDALPMKQNIHAETVSPNPEPPKAEDEEDEKHA